MIIIGYVYPFTHTRNIDGWIWCVADTDFHPQTGIIVSNTGASVQRRRHHQTWRVQRSES